MSLPRAARPLVEFSQILRVNGFAVAPDQTIGFIEAVGVLGPSSIEDIRQAALAMLAPGPDRRAEFDALFRAFFMGQTIAAPAIGDEDEDVEAYDDSDGAGDEPEEGEDTEVGGEAVTTEALTSRQFSVGDETEALRYFSRHAASRLPRRRSRRFQSAHKGKRPDLRRTLRKAVSRGGDVFTLDWRRPKSRQRPIVLLIDVSGSMKEQTDASLRFAHALVASADHAQVFTLGTRLTRVTNALQTKNRDLALGRVSSLVADWDGGTRIGEALLAFLSVPRFAASARGAAVIVLSDGLERGDPHAMIEAVTRLSRLAWRLDWLSPLAVGPDYIPQTEALAAVLPRLTVLSDGGSVSSICAHFLNMEKAA